MALLTLRRLARNLAAALLVGLGAGARAEAGVVAILADGGSAEVELTAAGFREAMGHAAPGTEVVVLSEAGALGEADLVLALGADAVRAAVAGANGVPVLAGTVAHAPWLDELAVPAVVTDITPEQQLRLLRQFVPDADAVGVIFAEEENLARVTELARAAQGMGITVEARRISRAQELPRALTALGRKVDALISVPDTTVYNPTTAKPLILFSFRNRIPLVGLSTDWVDAGALYAPVIDHRDLGAQCAEVAAQILGASPAQRITNPRAVHFVVNERSAAQLGVELPKGAASP